MTFDLGRARLKGQDYFARWRLPSHGVPLEQAKLKADELLLVVERGGEKRALLVRHLAFHHLAQGSLCGEPYMVSF